MTLSGMSEKHEAADSGLISLICLWARSRDIRPGDGTASCLPTLSAPPNKPRDTPAVKRKDKCAQEEQQKTGTEVGSMNTVFHCCQSHGDGAAILHNC